MTKKGTVHVVPNKNGGWVVKKGGQSSILSHHERKDDAVESGRKISKREKSELYIHGRDGRFQRKDSHGSAPYPPEG